MPKPYTNARNAAFEAQGGLCYYCDKPMWIDNPSAFARLHHLPENLLKNLQATAEHLMAQCDGGTNARANIVAAHALCNRRRHQRRTALPPDHFRALVQRRIASCRWHPPLVLNMRT